MPDFAASYRLIADTVPADTLVAFRTLLRHRTGTVSGKAPPSVTPSSCNGTATANIKHSNASTPCLRVTAVGQSTLLLIRSPLKRQSLRSLANALRPQRKRSVSMLTRLNASAGMPLAATLATQHHPYHLPPAMLRLISSPSSTGPHRLGIGILPPFLHTLLALLLALLAAAAATATLLHNPALAPWAVAIATIAFATRPNLPSFFQWVRESAPHVVARKALVVDKLRASVAPYVLQFIRRPTLADYGLFSLVTATDADDYVYVYAGVLSRWCLLGWYNRQDDYNFDPWDI